MICIRCDKKTSSGTHMDEGLVCSNCVNMQKYREGRDTFFLCKLCGEADSPSNWMGNVLEDGLCFGCSFWARNVHAYRCGTRPQKLVINGDMYHVGNEEPSSFRGFGGRHFMIQILETGRTFVSTNLWYNGKIPDRWRCHTADNAKFIQKTIDKRLKI